ncbi:hypothetical protein ACFL1H_07725, partial [Nanoarchaeota archaeon]
MYLKEACFNTFARLREMFPRNQPVPKLEEINENHDDFILDPYGIGSGFMFIDRGDYIFHRSNYNDLENEDLKKTKEIFSRSYHKINNNGYNEC